MSSRSSVALLGACFLAGAGCLGIHETPLETMRDLVDRPGLADAGHAPAMAHPHGVRFELGASLVEEGSDEVSENRAFDVSIRVDNESGDTVRLGNKWWIADDEGRRFRRSTLLLWNPETEDYETAPETLPPGAHATLVARFPVPAGFRLIRVLQVALHWRYQHAGKKYAACTRFRVR